MNFFWYMTFNKVQAEYEKGGFAPILTAFISPYRCEKNENIWFPLNKVRLNDRILLKFIYYLTINKVQVEFEKGGHASIVQEIMASDRQEDLCFFLFFFFFCFFLLSNLSLNELILMKFIQYLTISKVQIEFKV